MMKDIMILGTPTKSGLLNLTLYIGLVMYK